MNHGYHSSFVISMLLYLPKIDGAIDFSTEKLLENTKQFFYLVERFLDKKNMLTTKKQ